VIAKPRLPRGKALYRIFQNESRSPIDLASCSDCLQDALAEGNRARFALKTVYCITYGGGHVAIVDLICQELLKRSRITFRILALTTAYPQIVDSYPAATVRRMSDYLDLFDDQLDDILHYGERLAADTHDPSGGIALIESIAYLGLSYAELVQEHGATAAEVRYRAQGRHAFRPVRTLKRILEHEKADLVLATTSPRCEEAAILAGNELGLPTIQILDLFGDLYPFPAARHVVASDQESIETLRQRGVTSCQFHELGQPSFEEAGQKVATICPDAVRRKLGLAPGTPTLLWATSVPCLHRADHTIEQILPYSVVCGRLFPILGEVSRATGVQVLVRLHPNESFAAYQPWFDEYPEIRHVNPYLDLFESLAAADCVTTSYSTVGIQAMFCGKPVVTFRYVRAQHYPLPRLQRLPYHFANDMDELPALLIETLRSRPKTTSPSPREHGSAGRIADLLESLATR